MDQGVQDNWHAKYRALKRKCSDVERNNERLARKMYKTKKVLEHLKRERSILMEKLDHYQDNYREATKECEATAIASLTAMPHFPITPDAELGPGAGEVFHLTTPGEGSSLFSRQNAHIKSSRKSATKLLMPGGGLSPIGKKSAGRPSNSPLVSGSRVVTSSGGKTERDPNAPKKPSNAFFMFCQSHRTSIQVECLQSELTGHHDLTKLMAKKWKELPAEEKKTYYDMYEKDKARYASELRDYQEAQRSSSGSGQVTPTSSTAKKVVPLPPHLPAVHTPGLEDSDDSSGLQSTLQIDCAFPPLSMDIDSDSLM